MWIHQGRPRARNVRTRRVAGVLALLLFAASACSSTGAPQSPPVSVPSQTARQALTAAAEKLAQTTYKYRWELRGAVNANNHGHVDLKRAIASADIGSYRYKTSTRVQVQVLMDGADVWLLVTEPRTSDPKWVHTTVDNAGLDAVVGKLATDPTEISGWLSAVVDVDYDGTKLVGTVDLTKAPQIGPRIALTGDSAKAAPFSAEQDADGRLVSFNVDLVAFTGEPKARVTMRYFGFGSPLEISAPPSTELTGLTPALVSMLQ